MRLIDADVLINDIREHSTSYFADDFAHEWVDKQPTIELKIKPISYTDCANAMLKMWMINVVTDGEYYRIMDKLNAWEVNGGDE